MPLLSGSSDEVIGENIREMRNSGHSEAQAIAASMRNAGRSKKKKKGKKDPPKKRGNGGMKTMKPTKAGQKPITFKEGGLHASTGTKPGQKISAGAHAKAKSGALGPKAKKQETFYENVLRH